MKSKIYSLLIISILSLAACNVVAQDLEMQLIENEMGYLEVQVRETTGLLPTTATNISQITFEIRWEAVLGADIALICSDNDYNLVDGVGLGTEGIYNWRNFVANPIGFAYPNNWSLDGWETIATFMVTGTGTGDFDIAPAGWVPQDLQWKDALVPSGRSITLVGSVTGYSFPTLIYDLVWTGLDATYPTFWDVATNWETECGGTGSIPNSGNNCFIPVLLSGNYPSELGQVSGGFPARHQPICDYLRISSGASLVIDNADLAASTQVLFTVNNGLIVNGTLSIVPNGQLTVDGATTINSTEGIFVQADATGIGSFIDNGTIYGTGTAKVQTHLINESTAPSFQIHLVGPTVDMGGGEVPLSAFAISGVDTYAYEYDEPTGDWLNIHEITSPIAVAKGIGLSTADGNDYTIEMTGALNYGTIYSPAMTSGGAGTGYNMISNPYPSSIFWDDMYGDNILSVNDIVYIWDGSIAFGNYRVYNQVAGGTDNFSGYIQVGQGFFVKSQGAGTFELNNSQRHHSADPFYAPNSMTNRLDVRVAGTNYRDGLLLHFREDATSGFEVNEDAPKRDSPYDEAPEIWTNLEDGSRLSINAMPSELLNNDMLSVPLSFKCGVTDTYTLSFIDIESFEQGTEIWLEDKQIGNDWISISSDSEYTFSATPNDLKERFVLHFYGPTGLNEFGIRANVDIYSNQNFAYLVNNTDELIKKVEVYTLSGGLVLETKVPDQKAHKLYISDEIGYYMVRVTTDKNIYTNKIFISF